MAQHFSGSNQYAARCTLERKGKRKITNTTRSVQIQFTSVWVFPPSCLPPPTRLERRASAFWRSPQTCFPFSMLPQCHGQLLNQSLSSPSSPRSHQPCEGPLYISTTLFFSLLASFPSPSLYLSLSCKPPSLQSSLPVSSLSGRYSQQQQAPLASLAVPLSEWSSGRALEGVPGQCAATEERSRTEGRTDRGEGCAPWAPTAGWASCSLDPRAEHGEEDDADGVSFVGN